MIDFCKSCIDPTRPMTGEEASSEGYATPRSLETPVQKCPSLHQIRDPYASRHPASLRLTEEEKRQRLAKFATSSGRKSTTTPDPTSPNNESIYTILIKLPETSHSSKNPTEKTLNSNTKSKSRTSIQQLLSEPDPALIKTMKRCDSEHIRSASTIVNTRGRNGRKF